MDPITVNLIIAAIEAAVKLEPQIAAELQTLFAKGTPTPEDFAALRARVLASDYKALVPNSALS